MDLTSILNNSDDRDHRPHQPSDSFSAVPPPQPARRQPPPPLSTARASSQATGHPHSAAPSFERQHSALSSYSPGPPYSASSHTPTPHSSGPPSFPSPFPRNAPLPSPSRKTSVSTPTSYFGNAQRPVSNHSGGRTSSSPFDNPNAYAPVQSPTIIRHNSYHPTIPSPQAPHPQTPLAPPPLPRADSSQNFNQIQHPSPSFASLASPHRPSLQTQRSQSYSASDYQVSVPPPQHVNGSPADHRRRSSGHSFNPPRQHSASVSPKTVVQPNPATKQTPPKPEPSIVLDARAVPHQTSGPSASLLQHQPMNSSAVAPLQPAPEMKTKVSQQPTAMPQDNSKRMPPSGKTIAGTKRGAENDIAPAAAAKRPRTVKEPPIWAQRRKGLKAMSHKATPVTTNGHARPNGPVAGTAIADAGFEPSVTNIIPYEDITRQVATFIFARIQSAAQDTPFEIEAKIGVICEPQTHDRIRIPVASETILEEGRVDLSFESQMHEGHHRAMNKYLNDLVLDSNRPPSSPQKPARVAIDYKHKREVDEFYELPVEEQKILAVDLQNSLKRNSWKFKPKVRVTREQQTGRILQKIVKSRVADLHIFCPTQRFDCRISINLEQEWAGELATLTKSAEPDRIKDRLSYSHQWCQIDLTQVKSSDAARKPTHELEVEIEMGRLRQEARLAAQNRPESKYEDMIKVFLDNVRTLARHNPS